MGVECGLGDQAVRASSDRFQESLVQQGQDQLYGQAKLAGSLGQRAVTRAARLAVDENAKRLVGFLPRQTFTFR